MRNYKTLTRRTSRPTLRRSTRRAFTLLEMMVVVTIIALLATLIGPKVFKALKGANVSVAKQQSSSIQSNVTQWLMENNYTGIPNDFSLDVLTEGDDRTLNAKDLVDPWGNPYVLEVGGYDIDFDVISYGADGQPGGEGDDMDIINGKTADYFSN